MKHFYSFFLFLITFAFHGSLQAQCDFSITMNDSYGDGWNGSSVQIIVNGTTAGSWTLSAGSTGTATYPAADGDEIDFVWSSGSQWDSEVSMTITDPTGAQVYQGPAPADGALIGSSSFSNPACAPCDAPVAACAQSGNSYGQFGFSNITIGTQSNNPGFNNYADYASCAYAAETAGQGSSLSLSITNGNGTYAFNYSAAFDWNNDGVFEATVNFGNVAPNAIATSSVTVPSNATLGRIRARFISAYSPAENTPCVNAGYGSINDYAIEVTCGAITVSGDQNACQGGSGTMVADVYPGGTWSSDNPSVADIDNSGNITAVSGGTANMTYTAPDGECSGTTGSLIWTTLTAPNAGTISGTQTVAPNATTTLSSDGDVGGTWTSDNTAVATVDASSGVVTGVFAGTANITYTLTAAGCPEASTSTAVSVGCASDIIVTYGDVEHCSGNSSTLSGSISDANVTQVYTFSGTDSWGDGWNGSTVTIDVDGEIVVQSWTNENLDGVSGGTAETQTVSFSASQGQTINFTWVQGQWTGEVSWTLTGADGSVIESAGAFPASLSASYTLPGNPVTYTYAWTPTSGLDDATSASPVASNSATETYNLLVTSSTGCTGTDAVVATINNPTAGTLTGTQTLVPGGTTTISSNGTTGGEWTDRKSVV